MLQQQQAALQRALSQRGVGGEGGRGKGFGAPPSPSTGQGYGGGAGVEGDEEDFLGTSRPSPDTARCSPTGMSLAELQRANMRRSTSRRSYQGGWAGLISIDSLDDC